MEGESKVFIQLDEYMPTQVFTVKQASYHLKYSVRTIHQWIDEGKLIAHKVCGILWIPYYEINRIAWRDSKPPYLSCLNLNESSSKVKSPIGDER